MKTTFSFLLTSLLAANAFAANSIVAKEAAKMKSQDTRTIIKEIDNKEGNPCLPEGKSYEVDLQVKQASYDHLNDKVVYTWETAKTINVDKNGAVSEVCAE